MRDGRCSNSIVLYCDEDRTISTETARGRDEDNIGEEKAYLRWESLYQKKKAWEDEKIIVDAFKTVPPYLIKTGYKGKGKGNHFHNQITLFTMARAKMIEIHNAPPNLKSMDQVDEIPEEYWDRYYREMHLKILDDRHLVEENFKKIYAKARVLLRDHRLSSNALMLKVIDSEITVESALNKIYSNNQPGRLINIVPICGCPKKPEGIVLLRNLVILGLMYHKIIQQTIQRYLGRLF